MSRITPVLGFIFILIAPLVAPLSAHAANVPLDEALSPKVMGDANAPLTLNEYSSMSCPHCAAFDLETLPLIKKEYIDTGKLKLVYHDFPLNSPAIAAAMVLRCAGNQKYFALMDMLFRAQAQWAASSDPVAGIKKVVRFAAISDTDVDECLSNATLLRAIQDAAQKAEKDLGVNSTPTFFLEGTKIPGALSIADFRSLINNKLKALGK